MVRDTGNVVDTGKGKEVIILRKVAVKFLTTYSNYEIL